MKYLIKLNIEKLALFDTIFPITRILTVQIKPNCTFRLLLLVLNSPENFMKIGDVVGFGINGLKRELFFTLNGFKLEETFHLKETLHFHPLFAFKGDGTELELNYGREPFVYLLNIDNVVDAWLGAHLFQRKMFLNFFLNHPLAKRPHWITRWIHACTPKYLKLNSGRLP